MRKKTLKRQDYAAISAWAAKGLRREDIARQLGMDAKTLRRILAEDEAAAEALGVGESALHDELVGLLLKKAREGNVAATIFALKAKCGYRENAPIQIEDRRQITIALPAAMPEEKYARVIGRGAALPGPAVDDAKVVDDG